MKRGLERKKAYSLYSSLRRYGVKMNVPSIIRWMRKTPKCVYCGLPIAIADYSLDHIQPRSRGGADSKANLHLIDRSCNLMKGNLTDEEFRTLLTFLKQYPTIYNNVRTRLKMAGFMYKRMIPTEEDLAEFLNI